MFKKISLILAVSLMVASMSANAVKAYEFVTDGLVSYWPFDAASIQGEIVKDAWGNSDGTMVSSPQVVDGKIGEALKFDGVDDFINCGSDASLDITSPMTIEAWFKYDVWETGYIVAKRQGGIENTQYYLGTNKDAKIIIIRSGAEEIPIENADTLGGAWHHLVGVINGADSRIYLDAVEIASGELPDPPSQVGNVHIGARGTDTGGGAWFFNGLLDEVRIYNRALSQSEVEQNFLAEGAAAVSYRDNDLASTWGKMKTLQ